MTGRRIWDALLIVSALVAYAALMGCADFEGGCDDLEGCHSQASSTYWGSLALQTRK